MLSLKINPDKTEMILFHPKSMKHQVIIGGTIVGDECIRYSKEVKNVGVLLDQHLDMNKHINNTVSLSWVNCTKLVRVPSVTNFVITAFLDNVTQFLILFPILYIFCSTESNIKLYTPCTMMK